MILMAPDEASDVRGGQIKQDNASHTEFWLYS